MPSQPQNDPYVQGLCEQSRQSGFDAGYELGRASVLEQLQDELLPQLRKLSTTVAVVAQVFDAIAAPNT